MLTDVEMAHIYEELGGFRVSLLGDINLITTSYVAQKVAEISDFTQKVNEYSTQVERELGQERSRVKHLKAWMKIATRDQFLNMQPEEKRGCTQAQLQAKAESFAEDVWMQQQLRDGVEEEEAVSIAKEISDAEVYIELLAALQHAIDTKRSELKQLDSGVRLQHNALASQYSAFAAPPKRSVPELGSEPSYEEAQGKKS